MHKKYLTYEQFGAKGDGITNDQHAIFECHSIANKRGIPVKAKDGAKYYIGCDDLTAIVRTDVYFGTAEFIIDDTSVVNRKSAIFKVESDYKIFPINCTYLSCTQSNISNPISEELFVKIHSNEKKVFIRKGLNQNEGVDICDCFTLDINGKIKNRLNWNYTQNNNVYARKIDNRQIVIEGGIFTTIANKSLPIYNYYERGIVISRDNVVVKKIKHNVIQEGKFGAPYRGFLSVIDCVNVLVENCIFTPHRTYFTASKIPGRLVPMGSYDIYLESSIKVQLRNLRQTIDIIDSNYWGIMSSNFCKELTLSNCELSRFDAHMGVTDAFIVDCRLGYQGISIIGNGELKIKNTIVKCTNYITLRSDYGSHWDGTVEIVDGTWIPMKNTSIIGAINDMEHDFGYKCRMPNIFINGLRIKDMDLSMNDDFVYYVLPDYKPNSMSKKTEYAENISVSITNILAESGRLCYLLKFENQYPGISYTSVND